MWIIFDLDDTLIDTTGTLTPFQLKRALKKMVKVGLQVGDFSKAYFQLFSLNQKTLSSDETLRVFFALHEFDQKFLKIGVSEVYSPDLPQNFPLKPLPGVKEILEYFSDDTLFLVTKGVEKVQRKKLEKAGIEPQVFSKIFVTGSEGKKPAYEKILRDAGLNPKEVVVIGDRIGKDLIPAKELGFWTVQMKWGRGLCYEGNEEFVDFEIAKLDELKAIIHQLKILNGTNV